jgi:hypothetical protein
MSTPTSARSAKGSAETQARRAANSDTLNKAARLGFLAKGLVYALIGLLAFQVATGSGSKRTDQKGALQEIASKPGGTFVLWLMVLGFLAYAVWRFSEAAWGRQDETDEKKRTAKRIGSAANGLVYLSFALLSFKTVTGGSSSNGGADITAKVLGWPGGQVLVFLGGLVVIVIAVALTWRGLKTDFEKHLDTSRMSRTTFTAVRRLGQVGYVARGAVFFLIGGLVIKAAMDNQPGKAQGFDVALKSLAGAPFGQVLLIAAALGLVCFGAYCVAEARYRRL